MIKEKQPQLPQGASQLPQIWWYEPFIHNITEIIKEIISDIERNPKYDSDDFKSKYQRSQKSRCMIWFAKIDNGCNDLGNNRGIIALENKLKELFPHHEVFRWLQNWYSDWNEKWTGFDKEIFSRDAELAKTTAAIEYRRKRGFDWQWKEERI